MENNLNRTYTLPNEINSEMNLKGTPVSVIVGGILMLFVAQKLDFRVYEPLKIVWYIYNALIGMILMTNSSQNIGKRKIQSIFIFLTSRKHKVYMPIPNPKSYDKMKEVKIDETPDSKR